VLVCGTNNLVRAIVVGTLGSHFLTM
jgi:hypothetical protein